VLTYHGFGPRRSVTVADPSWFAETVAALVEAGYRGVDLADWIDRGRPDEPRGFALAFDDGLRSVLRVADVLSRHRLPATLFLVTDRVGIDNAWPGQPPGVPVEPLLDWSEIEALARLGVRAAAHGRTHASLDRLSPARVEAELLGAREAIETRTGRPCRLFAYPYGASTPLVREFARHTYAAAFGTRLGYAGAGEDVHDLSRIDAYYLRTDRAVRSLVEGRAGGWLRWRRTLREARRRGRPVVTRVLAGMVG
jgi:peptidoglycan/xylan/chitin deacetylase (PgdA/CDA1 family)